MTAIDIDEDALTSARENLGLNQAHEHVRVEAIDLANAPGMDPSDIVTANLTGAMLERTPTFWPSGPRRAGTLIVSGFQCDEDEASPHRSGTWDSTS